MHNIEQTTIDCYILRTDAIVVWTGSRVAILASKSTSPLRRIG